jgi:hypothetical protein
MSFKSFLVEAKLNLLKFLDIFGQEISQCGILRCFRTKLISYS